MKISARTILPLIATFAVTTNNHGASAGRIGSNTAASATNVARSTTATANDVACPCFSYDELIDSMNMFGGNCELSDPSSFAFMNQYSEAHLSYGDVTEVTCGYKRESRDPNAGGVEAERDFTAKSEVPQYQEQDVFPVYAACREVLFTACNDCQFCTTTKAAANATDNGGN